MKSFSICCEQDGFRRVFVVMAETASDAKDLVKKEWWSIRDECWGDAYELDLKPNEIKQISMSKSN